MKFSISIALLAVFALAACEVDQPPPRNARRMAAARYPQQTTANQYPPEPQPFQSPADTVPVDPAVAPTTDTTTTAAATTTTTPATDQPSAAVSPAPKTAKGDYPYGVPVPGKQGFVRSPYSPDKMTDVRGYAPGTEVKDPYTGKIFLVP
jgi:hypothetical protein